MVPFSLVRPQTRRHLAIGIRVLLLAALGLAHPVSAHPYGTWSINHFTRLDPSQHELRILYVVDMAEVPAGRALKRIDRDGNGEVSDEERAEYGKTEAESLLQGLILTSDQARISLRVDSSTVVLPSGAGGLPTLRIEIRGRADLPGLQPGKPRSFTYSVNNYPDTAGWHEVVLRPGGGVVAFSSNAYGDPITNALWLYPDLNPPQIPQERSIRFSLAVGDLPAGALPLSFRSGGSAGNIPGPVMEIFEYTGLYPRTIWLVRLFAVALGIWTALGGLLRSGRRSGAAGGAFPGPGGIGVWPVVLGGAILMATGWTGADLAHRWIPFSDRAWTWSALALALAALGAAAFSRALSRGIRFPDHSSHEGALLGGEHASGGEGTGPSSPLVGAARTGNTPGQGLRSVWLGWQEVLLAGVMGAGLPWPDLGTPVFGWYVLGWMVARGGVGLFRSQGRRGYGFPGVGVAGRRLLLGAGGLTQLAAGLGLGALALRGMGIDLAPADSPALGSGAPLLTSTVLGMGLTMGIKHAIEADHVAAVVAIVSQRRGLLSASLVGGLWGLGHTVSLLVAGFLVLILRVSISERTAQMLEFGVALMLIWLGISALRTLRRNGPVHLHAHHHGPVVHFHPHQHGPDAHNHRSTHHLASTGVRPLLVGMVHGMAGSSALMLVVLSTVPSPAVGLMYLLLFGLGSVGGMMAMSALVSLPLHYTSHRFETMNIALRTAAGVLSCAIGAFLIYEIGFVGGLLPGMWRGF